EAPGLYVPAPPLQLPLAAPPPTAPASCTWALLAHTVRSAPASAVAAGLNVSRTSSLTCGQGPPVAALVGVSVTPPAAVAAAVGMYVAFRAEAPGLYVPAPPLQLPPLAPPPTAPAS